MTKPHIYLWHSHWWVSRNGGRGRKTALLFGDLPFKTLDAAKRTAKFDWEWLLKRESNGHVWS